jgi:hypothetical protein
MHSQHQTKRKNEKSHKPQAASAMKQTQLKGKIKT